MPDRYTYIFTVFTPTFNRAHTLNRVYESLQKQTFCNFEWLVVDDGSTDNTKQLVEQWQKQSNFPINYIYQTNQGKHIAINLAVAKARGELFLPLDSDDACVPHALETLYRHWQSIPAEIKAGFSGVCALCQDQTGVIVGNKYPADVFDSDPLEIKYRYKIKGEKWGFHKTDVMKQLPFPVIAGMKLISESIIWNAISRQYKTRFVNEALRIYWTNTDGAEQFSTGNPARYARELAFFHRNVLNTEIDWFWHAPLEFFRSAVHYGRFSFHKRVKLQQQIKELNNMLAKILWLTTLLLAFSAYWKDKKWITN